MQPLNYALAFLVSFLGLYCGLALAFIAPEELKAGRKYFILLTRIIFALVLAFLLLYFRLHWILVLVLVIGFFIMDYNHRIDERYIYALMAAALILSSLNTKLFILEASLIFLYGFPAGTLFTEKLVKKNIFAVAGKLFINYFHYLVIAALPLLVVYL